ncbi:hypothetical protein ACKKBF_B16150 [Auxenochlorella protothecoides x Auxenochlorella symbiontica]
MHPIFEDLKRSLVSISMHALHTEANRPECLRLARYVAKVSLIFTELEMHAAYDELLGGEQSLLAALDELGDAIRQADALISRCQEGEAGSVWPLEDSADFQAVAWSLHAGMQGLEAVKSHHIPRDVRSDIEHFRQQLASLNFSAKEMEASNDREAAHTFERGTSQENLSTSETSDVAAAVKALEGEGLTPDHAPDSASPSPSSPGLFPQLAPVQAKPASPLPEDPFNMTPHSLERSTLSQLEDLKDGSNGVPAAPIALLEGTQSLLPDTALLGAPGERSAAPTPIPEASTEGEAIQASSPLKQGDPNVLPDPASLLNPGNC